METAECSRECKVWQLGQISVLLKYKNKPFLNQTEKLPKSHVYTHTCAHTLPPSPDIAGGETDTLWSAASGNQ